MRQFSAGVVLELSLMSSSSAVAQQAEHFPAMAESDDPSFEVATIKPSPKDSQQRSIGVCSDIFYAHSLTTRAPCW